MEESIAAIQAKNEAERSRTRKRLQTLYGLLALAAMALVVAVVFYLNANKATIEAVKSAAALKVEKIKADSLGNIADKTVNKLINRDFYNIVKLTGPITAVGGNPKDYLVQLDSIAKLSKDDKGLRKSIDSIKLIVQSKKTK
jgi:hypothetical protein